MKRRILILTSLIICISALFLNIYKVEAYTGEIDPENYITLPSTIYIENKVGTGTITLSSSASDYNISYQKIDITKAKYDSITNKMEEINDYGESTTKTIKEKQDNLNTLKTEYENLQKESSTTEEELTAAKTKYEEAYTEYTEYAETVKTQIEKLQKEWYDLIPDYTSSWKTTTNSSNNVQLDFSNYTGTAYVVLWVKIDNGTNTYYDFDLYASEIKEETDTAEKKDTTTTTDKDWTDFSKAKFELKKDGISEAIVEISGVIPKEGSYYYIYITSTKNKPDVSDYESGKTIVLHYDEDSKTLSSNDVTKYVELNQDLYASIVENQGGTYNVISYGNKLTRFSEAKYSDAFLATFVSYDEDQIVTNFTHAEENNRKIEIKIGKITDTSILKKLKNQDSSGFSDLMSFAKSNKGIYDKTLDAEKNNYAIGYYAGGIYKTKGNSVINLKGLEDEAYYFLYVKTDDENGKYISNEAVTLAQADVITTEQWYMFFYGSSDFKWADFGSSTGSTTTTDNTATSTPKTLPYTGITSIVFIVLVITICGVYCKHESDKYKGI